MPEENITPDAEVIECVVEAEVEEAPKPQRETHPYDRVSKKELAAKIAELEALNKNLSEDLTAMASRADECLGNYRNKIHALEKELAQIQNSFQIVAGYLDQTRNLIQLITKKQGGHTCGN